MNLRTISVAVIAAATLISFSASAAEPNPSNWNAVVAAAKGQTVYWNAWAGEPAINDYIAWVGQQTNHKVVH